MRNKNDIFDNIDDETVEKLSEEFPVLTDEEKERLFAMSERKYNIVPEHTGENDGDVNGVEHYSRPAWQRFAGIAAAIALIVGGIGGGAFFMNNMKKSAPQNTAASETETQPTTEEPQVTTAAEDDDEFMSAAIEITDRYKEVYNAVYAHDLELEGGNMLTFNNEYGYEVTFFEVIDKRFPDMASLRNMYDSLYGPYIPETEYLFGGEFTSEEFPQDEVLPWEISTLKFMTYDGKLYVSSVSGVSKLEWKDDDIQLTYISDNEFYASRKCFYALSSENEEHELFLDIVRNTRTGGWLVSAVSFDSPLPDPQGDGSYVQNTAEDNEEANALIEKHTNFFNEWQYGLSMPEDANDVYTQEGFLVFNIQHDTAKTVYYRRLDNYTSLAEFADDIREIYTDDGFKNIYGVDINDFDKCDLSSHFQGEFLTEAECSTVIQWGGAVFLRIEEQRPFFISSKRIESDQISDDGENRTIQAYILDRSNGGSEWAASTDMTFELTKGNDGKFRFDQISFEYTDEQQEKMLLATAYEGYKNFERLAESGVFRTDSAAPTIPSDVEYRPYVVCTEFSTVSELRNYLEQYVKPELIDEYYPDIFGGEYPVFKDIDGQLYGKCSNSEVELYWGETMFPIDPEEDMQVTYLSDTTVMVDFICHSHIEDSEPFVQRMYAEKTLSSSSATPWKVTQFEYLAGRS